MAINKWQIIRDYFNSKKCNKIFTRAEYMSAMVKALGLYAPETYLDTCRCYLQNAGYLKLEEPGVYRKVKKIPNDLSITKLYKEAYK